MNVYLPLIYVHLLCFATSLQFAIRNQSTNFTIFASPFSWFTHIFHDNEIKAKKLC